MAKRFRAMLVVVLATLLVVPMPPTLETASAANPSQPGLDFAEVSAGWYHSLAITTDGSLYAWGSNNRGQLGDGSTDSKDAPVSIYLDGKKVTAVSAGAYHSLAITEDGSLYAWGFNLYGQLGDKTNNNRNAPVLISVADKIVTAVSAGAFHSLAITEDGSLYAWGVNFSGQLGNQSQTSSNTPVAIKPGTSFKAVSAGGDHSLAITEGGFLYAWGRNGVGQLGDGTKDDRDAPVLISVADKTFKSVSAGRNHSLAITTDDSLYAWGSNEKGQLGDGSVPDRNTPVAIMPGINFKAVSANGRHSLAIKEDGSLYAWGENTEGRLGDGTTTHRNIPVLISVDSKAIAAFSAGLEHSLAITSDGMLYAWGSNEYGQLSFGATSVNVPIDYGQDVTILATAAGYLHSLAITTDGSLYAWGANHSGQLGNQSQISSNTPVDALPGTIFKAVAAGLEHSLAITSDGMLYAWGLNDEGQLGDGDDDARDTPYEISVDDKIVTAISAGGNHSLAITEDGSLYAWGYNDEGQLGDGDDSSRDTPYEISVDDKIVTAISAGYAHSLAITEDGSLYAWGYNDDGQLGDGDDDARDTPYEISVDDKIVIAISAGGNHSLAVTADGSLYAWGANWAGQLGNGSTDNSVTPQAILPNTSFKAVAAGDDHSLAITDTGALYAWGYNEFGQIGNESRTDSNVPVAILPGTSFKAVSAGGYHSMAIKADDSVSLWGSNDSGQLANPSIATWFYLQPTVLSVAGVPSADSANSAPAAYAGPLATSFSASVVSAGDDLTISGQRLDTVSGITIDGVDVSIAAQTAGSLSIVIPAGLKSGVKNLKIASTAGMLTVQGAFRLLEDAEIQPETSSSSATKGWTKRLTDTTVKIYAKDLVGAGKVQFMFNGEEIAWVNAVSAADSKLKIANGANYLVRTVNLVPGQKNVFEVHLDGERIRRSAYSY